MRFVHLHTHSHYSLLDGLSQIKALVEQTKELGMDALALTDHGNLYGAIEFYQKAKKTGIKSIIGCEVYVTENRYDRRPHPDRRDYFHLTLLAKNFAGYQNLIRLVTAAHLEGFYYKPRVDKNLLQQHHEGLIALSGCLGGEISRALLSQQSAKAKKIALEHQKIFGAENYYLEIQQHLHTADQNLVTPQIVQLAHETGIPLVATQDSHYLKKGDAEAHDVLLAVQTGNKISDVDRLSMKNDDFSLASPDEMAEKFKAWPEAIANTVKIAERCNLELTLGKFIFPDFELASGQTADQRLETLTREGISERGLDHDQSTEERRRYELEVIKRKNYAPYFLVVADLIRFARQSHIYTTVRGSAAGSLVAYLAGITNVNPLEFQLPFERFLNPFRPSAPDIDMDFADNRRQEVIDYAKKKYGTDKVAQIGTFGTMMARGAVRDVARALGKPYEVGDRIAKLIPFGSQGFPMTIESALKIEPELKKVYEQDGEARKILDIAQRLEGTARHVSVHAAGVVIAPRPLNEYVPIQFDPKGEDNLITQYDMYTIGEDGVGLTKLDFLGIRNLAILENAVRLIKERHEQEIDIEKIPFDDQKTFAMLARGETEGLFQLNGSGLTRFLMDLKPTTIHDLNAMVALYRPGPMNNIPEYIARKHGRNPVKYFHPKAEKFLAKSYGLLVYQDDLLFTALELAGYNWESVDKFRKAVGKKIPAEMAKQHQIFVEGCQTHSNIPQNKAEEIWNLFEPFQGYGFNKAHAACYGRVAYQTAYLKANFPTEYMCAVLAAEVGDIEKIAVIIAECERMGIQVLPPDLNESLENFSIIGRPRADIALAFGTQGQSPVRTRSGAEELNVGTTSGTGTIRFGLTAIKNVGENMVKAIIAERKKGGGFKAADDFVQRVQNRDLNKKSLESLIKCGALDIFGERNVLLVNVDQFLNYSRDFQRQSLRGQISLFGDQTSVLLPPLRLVSAPPASFLEKLKWEKELLGLFISGHPLKSYQTQLSLEPGLTLIKDVSPQKSNQIKIGGIVTKVQKIITKTGRPMLFSLLEDLTAKIEVVVFPSILEKNPALWQENSILVVKGKLNDRDGVPKLLCAEVKLLTSTV